MKVPPMSGVPRNPALCLPGRLGTFRVGHMRLGFSVIAATAASVLLAAPSSAQELKIEDPVGDKASPGLDIVAARVDNRDHRVVAWVRFAEDLRGEVIVSVDRRHGQGLRMVSEHRPARQDLDFVVPGAFSDKAGGAEVRCSGYRVRWRDDRPVMRMTLPARCLNSGNYGAVQVAVLTERGDDTDYAPEPLSSGPWVPRG